VKVASANGIAMTVMVMTVAIAVGVEERPPRVMVAVTSVAVR
jgi:hypothetical protein